MIAQIAPAVRVAIAETMGLNPGDVTVGQLVAGLRMLGFDYVFGESSRVPRMLLLLQAKCRHTWIYISWFLTFWPGSTYVGILLVATEYQHAQPCEVAAHAWRVHPP
jgi:hypothetical protein